MPTSQAGWICAPLRHGVRLRGAAHAGAALAELEACAGSQFDPRLVRLFVAEYALHQDQLP